MRLVRRGDHPGIIADQKSKVLLKQLTTPYHIHIPTLCNKDGGINYAKGRSHGIRQSFSSYFCMHVCICTMFINTFQKIAPQVLMHASGNSCS